MGEPFGAAAAGIQIAAFTLHGVRLLLKDVEHIREAPRAVAKLKDGLREVEMAVDTLNAVERSKLEALRVSEQSLSVIKTCEESCEKFRNDLRKWTKHSEDGKLHWMDRIKVGFFEDERIKSLSGEIQNCKTTLTMVVSIATLNSSIRQSDVTAGVRKEITESQIELAVAIESTDTQITEVGKRLEAVSLRDHDQEGDEPSEKARAIEQIEEEKKALKESRELFKVLLAETEQKSKLKVGKVDMSNEGQVLVGLVNTKGKYDVEVVLDDIKATNKGKGSVGIVEGLDLSNFFK